MGLYIESRQGREAAKAGFDFAIQLMVLPTGLDRGKQFRGGVGKLADCSFSKEEASSRLITCMEWAVGLVSRLFTKFLWFRHWMVQAKELDCIC
uniref:Uncharacterized protein n=1 Tax=Ditylenchus dipsaci TaxID=166011 RepID=A0A915EIC1_9BILA